MYEHNLLFSGKYSTAEMLAEMIALLGPPPLEFLKKSEESLKYWDESGTVSIFHCQGT